MTVLQHQNKAIGGPGILKIFFENLFKYWKMRSYGRESERTKEGIFHRLE
jgi:hypothetical protein